MEHTRTRDALGSCCLNQAQSNTPRHANFTPWCETALRELTSKWTVCSARLSEHHRDANIIRHTAAGAVFMGRRTQGSATGKRYIHRRPEYLRGVIDGIEALFRALSEFVEQPFKGLEWTDQRRLMTRFRAYRVPVRANPAHAPLQLVEFGAGNETRTRDPDLGKVVLYQLSYSRIPNRRARDSMCAPCEVKVNPAGIRPRNWLRS